MKVKLIDDYNEYGEFYESKCWVLLECIRRIFYIWGVRFEGRILDVCFGFKGGVRGG